MPKDPRISSFKMNTPIAFIVYKHPDTIRKARSPNKVIFPSPTVPRNPTSSRSAPKFEVLSKTESIGNASSSKSIPKIIRAWLAKSKTGLDKVFASYTEASHIPLNYRKSNYNYTVYSVCYILYHINPS